MLVYPCDAITSCPPINFADVISIAVTNQQKLIAVELLRARWNFLADYFLLSGSLASLNFWADTSGVKTSCLNVFFPYLF